MSDEILKKVESIAQGEVGVSGTSSVSTHSPVRKTLERGTTPMNTTEKKEKCNAQGIIIVTVVLGIAVYLLANGNLFASKFGNSRVRPLSQYKDRYDSRYDRDEYYIGDDVYRQSSSDYNYYNDDYNEDYRSDRVDDRLYEMDRKIDNLKHKVEANSQKTYLLAVANNENAQITKKLAQRTSQYSHTPVMIDERWNLTKMPEFVALSVSDRQELANYVTHKFEVNYQPTTTYYYQQPQHRRIICK